MINISERRYKLHLTSEQLDLMKRVFENHSWFCNCEDFPKCEDFKMFQKLKNRLYNLLERSFDNEMKGHKAHMKLKTKYMIEGRKI